MSSMLQEIKKKEICSNEEKMANGLRVFLQAILSVNEMSIWSFVATLIIPILLFIISRVAHTSVVKTGQREYSTESLFALTMDTKPSKNYDLLIFYFHL